jgi:hypothetical protein
MSRLVFLKSIAETLACEYEINWDTWDNEETLLMQERIDSGLEYYESKFHFLMDQDNELTDEEFQELEETLDNLLSGYTMMVLMNKKKAIDELLLTV